MHAFFVEIRLLNAGQDRMTSRASTFPYTERRCGQFLQTLSLHRGMEATTADDLMSSQLGKADLWTAISYVSSIRDGIDTCFNHLTSFQHVFWAQSVSFL